jgi:hypothetical protein
MPEVRRFGTIGLAIALGGAAAFAQQKPAAILLEAVAVNHESLVPSSDNIVASRGDIITAHLFVEAWSPNGEVIRAYQATIPQQVYESGDAGNIKPVNYDGAIGTQSENSANAFIEIGRPDFAFRGLQTVAIVDTISYDYRWLGVIVDNEQSFACPDPKKKYYGGTLRLRVSDDAAGTFTIGFVEADWATVIRDVNNIAIAPMKYGKLSITVPADGVIPPRITGSMPPHEAIIAVRPSNAGALPIDVYFNVEVPDMGASDFVFEDGSDNPPKVTRAVPVGRTVTVTPDKPLRPFAWTTITHAPSGTRTRIGCLPGDVNGDGLLNSKDIASLIAASTQSTNPLASHQSDINADGVFDVLDALDLIEILNGPTVYRHSLR